MDDRELLARLRQGDEDAFDTLFRAHYAALVRVAELLLHEGAVAEEVVQDVMLELWRRRESLVLEEPPRAYLYRAVRNRALNCLRRLRVERRDEPRVAETLVPPLPADAGAGEAELEVAIRTAIRELPDRCREVFELSRVQGLAYAAIAETLGISVKTVEAQMGKALRLLRARLAPWLEPRPVPPRQAMVRPGGSS